MKGKNCLHCGVISSVCKVHAGLCGYCKSVVSKHFRKIFAEINNGNVSFCFVCHKLEKDGKIYKNIKTDYIKTNGVCASCDKAFASVE